MCLPDEIDKKLAKENAKELLRNIVSPLRQSINHMGVVKTRGVKTRGQSNTSFKTICVVLNEGMLEYYEDERSYLFNKERGLKGSIQTKNIKITSATFSGVVVSNDGYHFTIEDTSSGKLIEYACEDAQSRDLWVGKIKASYHNATVECESVAIVLHMKPKKAMIPGESITSMQQVNKNASNGLWRCKRQPRMQEKNIFQPQLLCGPALRSSCGRSTTVI
jgi:hypothetical protein